jgi:hypothetical protein
MGVLDQITKMKKRGLSEQDIVNDLSQKGVSPREINDALKQSQIKNAVSDFDEGMQPSMDIEGGVPVPNANEETQEYEAPQSREVQSQSYAPMVQEPYQQEEYAPQQEYSPQESQDYSQGGVNTDTIIEIAEQIFSDKIRKFQKQGDANSEAIVLLQTKVDNVSERLKKIETIIDKLQIAILEKIGSYGQNLEGIKKEMSMMQDSFSKSISAPREFKKLPSQTMQSQERYIPSDEAENIKESLKDISRKK